MRRRRRLNRLDSAAMAGGRRRTNNHSSSNNNNNSNSRGNKGRRRRGSDPSSVKGALFVEGGFLSDWNRNPSSPNPSRGPSLSLSLLKFIFFFFLPSVIYFIGWAGPMFVYWENGEKIYIYFKLFVEKRVENLTSS